MKTKTNVKISKIRGGISEIQNSPQKTKSPKNPHHILTTHNQNKTKLSLLAVSNELY